MGKEVPRHLWLVIIQRGFGFSSGMLFENISEQLNMATFASFLLKTTEVGKPPMNGFAWVFASYFVIPAFVLEA